MSRRNLGFLVFAGCIAIAFAIYWPCLGNQFYNDDVVFLNEARDLRKTPSGILSNVVMGFYRPFFTGYIAILSIFFETNPLGYYICGIVIHGFTGFLMWALARKWIPGELGPLAAAFAFLTFFSHSEATLWISSHNSSMLATLSILAMLGHNWYLEKGGVWRALLTAIAFAAVIFTKETGLTVIGWVFGAQIVMTGWRSLLTKRTLFLVILYAAVVAFYVLKNPRLSAGFMTEAERAAFDSRVSLANVTPKKVLSSYAWLFSPLVHTQEKSLAGWRGTAFSAAGVAAILAPFAWAWFRRRDLLRPTLIATWLAGTGLAAPCMFVNLSANSSRFYYYSTIGAALILGVFAAAAERCADGTKNKAAPWFTILLLVYGAIGTWQIWRLNDLFFRPASVNQTAYIKNLMPDVGPRRRVNVFLLEPEIPNSLHIENALRLFCLIPASKVTMSSVPKEKFDEWLSANRGSGPLAPKILDWSRETKTFFEAKEKPRRGPTDQEIAHGLSNPEIAVRIVRISP